MKLIFPSKSIIILVSVLFFFVVGLITFAVIFDKEINEFKDWFYFIGILVILIPLSYIYACGYFFSVSFVKQVMKKKIFVAGKDPSKFFWKKVSYITYPYTASILGGILGFFGPAYYYYFKMMKEK